MVTIKEHINNLVESNSKHIAELKSEEEVKQWLNSILWAVAGFKQSIDEEELENLAQKAESQQFQLAKQGYSLGQCIGVDFIAGYKAGYRKAKGS